MSSSSSNATRRIALDEFRLCDAQGSPVSSPKIASKPVLLKGHRDKKHASVNILMGLEPRPKDDGSLNDSNIDNRNRLVQEQSSAVVHDCSELGMTFVETDDQVGVLAERILRNI